MSIVTVDLSKCKICGKASPATYRIRCGWIHVCQICSFHQLDFLDTYEDGSSIESAALPEELVQYIEQQLQSSSTRFNNHIRQLSKHGSLQGKQVLDIGCGGGLFLKKARELGAEVTGIELDDGRAEYCRSKHGIDVVKRPIESDYWLHRHGTFDFVTLWDVIEHVNDPLATLQSASPLLKPNGILLLDTPARDAFYHQFGTFSYRLTGGRFPTFLNTLYSNHPFGHKQILATSDIKRLFEKSSLETLEIEKLHELSFPYEFYLEKIFRSKRLARLTAPLATLLFAVFRIRNKALAAARRLG